MLSATPPAAPDDAAPVPGLEVTREGGVVVLALSGQLDARTGSALVAAAAWAAGGADDVDRVDVDLRSVDAFTPEGAAALLACRELTDALPEGLHYRTGRGPGREALLAAYARSTLPPGV